MISRRRRHLLNAHLRTHRRQFERWRSAQQAAQAELGVALEIDRTSVGAAVSSLEERTIVERVAHASDARSYAIRLTAAGRRLADQASVLAGDAQDELLAGLTAGERRTLVALLQRIAGVSDER